MHDVSRSGAVRGDENFRVHARAVKIDRDHWRARQFSVCINRLAQQHFLACQRWMAVAADGMADDLSVNHKKSVR